MHRHTIRPARVNPILIHPSEWRESLSGTWAFALDPEDRGIEERWFEEPGAFDEPIEVPGTWQGQGFGGTDKERVRDFSLCARTLRATYTGTGWYGRSFAVPEAWSGRRVWLNFGGAHPSAEVWLNGTRLGENDLPFVPFGFDVTDLLLGSKPNHVTVRIHEKHRWLGFAYNWQGNWSGLYRDVELTATGANWLEWVAATPRVDGQQVSMRCRIGGELAEGLSLRMRVSDPNDGAGVAETEINVRSGEVMCELPVADPRLWSPDCPALYRLEVELLHGDDVSDAVSDRFGFVTFATNDRQFRINDAPYFMRGTGDFVSCPETASPDTDRDRWRRKLQTLRDYGYNMVRCQSYVYGPEYLDAADEVGLLVQSEMGMLGGWAGHDIYHAYGWPFPTPDCRALLKRQWDAVVARDVNHPSANCYCMSNEVAQSYHPRTAWQCYRDTKAVKPTALVIWTDGQYNEAMPGDFANAEVSEELERTCPKPLIQHEYRWWSSFPDPRVEGKYSGAIRPYAVDLARKAAAAHGIEHILERAAINSQRVQFIEAKGKMEACRRDHSAIAGISHFNAMDANPSPQGIIDEFYERKCIDAATWRETNGDTVVLSSLGFVDRVLAGGDRLICTLSVSDYSHPPFESPALEWALEVGEERVAEGRIAYVHEPFRTCPAGELDVTAPRIVEPVKGRLSATLSEGDRVVTNHWDLWVFPRDVALPDDVAVYSDPRYTWLTTLEDVPRVCEDALPDSSHRVLLAEILDEHVAAFARGGGRVILAASEGLVRPFPPKLGLSEGRYFFCPPANYPPYESGHNGTILAEHPMLGTTPHEGFADLQFYRMLAESPPLDLEPLGLTGGDPIVRAVHSYPIGRSLGYLAEGSFGDGGLILCALDLNQAWPEARYLLASMCRYAASDAFAPSLALSDAHIAAIAEATALP